jgi:geranylgeranyl diphosphate synthase type II
MDKAGGAKARSVEASCRSAEAFLKESAAWIEARLDRILPPASAQPRRLHGAMRYSLFAGGKRLRPALVLATTRMLGGTNEGAAAAACALEMIHTYSLIHDDLPAMDNDDLRRGRPTCHRKFGEALAILAGDALLTLAFETLAKHPRREDVPALVGVLASSAGTHGMAGGQVLDLLAEGKPATRPEARPLSAGG